MITIGAGSKCFLLRSRPRVCLIADRFDKSKGGAVRLEPQNGWVGSEIGRDKRDRKAKFYVTLAVIGGDRTDF